MDKDEIKALFIFLVAITIFVIAFKMGVSYEQDKITKEQIAKQRFNIAVQEEVMRLQEKENDSIIQAFKYQTN